MRTIDFRLRPGEEPAARLRTLTAADGPRFAEHVRGDLERLSQHLGWPARTADPAGASAWLGAYERGADGRILVAGIWDGAELLGGVVLFGHDEQHATAELGCWVVAAGEGRGLVAAACRAAIAEAAELGVQRLAWQAATTNERSLRLAERLGFRHEGTLRSHLAHRGARLDTDMLSLVGAEIGAAAAARRDLSR